VALLTTFRLSQPIYTCKQTSHAFKRSQDSKYWRRCSGKLKHHVSPKRQRDTASQLEMIYTTLKIGVAMFGGTFGKHLPECTAAHPKRPYSWSILVALSISTCFRVPWFTWQGNVDATPNEVPEVRKAAAKACFSVFPRLGLNRMSTSLAIARLRILETGSSRK